jgi:hypothetical protein
MSRYSNIDPWKGTHANLVLPDHWGVFLFVIVSWMVWETRDWMASTPLSQARKLEPYRGLITAVVIVLLAWGYLTIHEGRGRLAGSPAAWAGVLLFRPGLPDSKRIVLSWLAPDSFSLWWSGDRPGGDIAA